MIRDVFVIIVFFCCSVQVYAEIRSVSDINFIVDTECPYSYFPISLDKAYVTYSWEDSDGNDLGNDATITAVKTDTYCVTVTNDQGVLCNACVDIELLEIPYPVVIDQAMVCSESIGLGPTVLDFTSLILDGDMSGTWTDDDFVGVDMSNINSVDFVGVPFGTYHFSYTTDVGNCGLNVTTTIEVEVVDCQCPFLQFSELTEICNEGNLFLDLGTDLLDGEWSSQSLNITNDTLELNGAIPGIYDLKFTWFEIADFCPHEFETTIEIIGCFQAEEVIMVESSSNAVTFSWTDELQALELDIQVLVGPEGVRDENTYTISELLPSEQVGIEIFVNTEGYQYDNNLIAFGETWTVGIKESQLLSEANVYPNPSQRFLYIDGVADIDDVKISILSMSGFRLDKDIFLSKNKQIDISDLGMGTYLLRLEALDGVKYLLFIKVDG